MRIDREALKSQILEFCNQYVNETDIVIGVLRYGAHIPHIYQNVCLEKSLSPKRIHLLLSHMINFFPVGFFQDKNLLILDDTVYEGLEMNRLLSTLVDSYGIPGDRIHTATLIVHEQSKFEPDYPTLNMRLPDAQYIAWKEELASLVRQDIRPTERDHPLYYFEGSNLELGDFLSILESYGYLHPVGSDWHAPVFRISLTIDSSVLLDLLDLSGVEFDNVFKIRFYWNETQSGCRLTAAPMGFPKIDIPTFIQSSSRVLAEAVGLEPTFFENIYATHPQSSRCQTAFYFASRTIAALLLQRLLIQIVPRLRRLGCTIRPLPPEEVDGFVEYVFPKEYMEFYGVAFGALQGIVSSEPEADTLPFGEKWKKPECPTLQPRSDPLLPEIYRLLEFVTRQLDPATWDGVRWLPNKEALKGVAHHEFTQEFRDPCFISNAFDELLDSGLLRAKDSALNFEETCFGRVFLSGGEYNAVQASRIADTWRYEAPFVEPKLAEEEALDLWGPH